MLGITKTQVIERLVNGADPKKMASEMIEEINKNNALINNA